MPAKKKKRTRKISGKSLKNISLQLFFLLWMNTFFPQLYRNNKRDCILIISLTLFRLAKKKEKFNYRKRELQMRREISNCITPDDVSQRYPTHVSQTNINDILMQPNFVTNLTLTIQSVIRQVRCKDDCGLWKVFCNARQEFFVYGRTSRRQTTKKKILRTKIRSC